MNKATLYKMRWNIEVDFRTIKATLEMDVLRCKSRPMVDKEIAVYFLAYNLVRWAMAKAALLADVLPRVLSFTGAKRLLSAFADQLRRTSGDEIRTLIATVLRCIATLRLPQRPNRIEPRAKKRRPKNLPLLTVPRQVARDLILAQRTLNRVT
ncbi:MAG TPA: transposase [Acidiferrobacterales bacterium]|nr:transposase [Acidiferrobacterales bacterium]